MPNLMTVLQKSLRWIPAQHIIVETIGYVTLGLGIFLSLSLFTFDPSDLRALSMGQVHMVSNLAGPAGVQIAHMLLRLFGIMAAVFPVALTLWGSLMIFGFVVAPQVHRVAGLLLITMIGSGICYIQFSTAGFREPSFGFGGIIGFKLGLTSLQHFGFLGAHVVLIVAGCVSLALTGNIAISNTKTNLKFLWHRLWQGFAKVSSQYNKKQLSDDELIKLALREELKSSRRVAEKTNRSVTPSKVSKGEKSLDTLIEDAMEEASAESDISALNIDPDAVEKINFYYTGKPHHRPDSSMFSRSSKAKERGAEFKKMAEKLAAQLAEFKVDGKVSKIVEGPVVTTFEFEPQPGTKVSKITGLSQDLARLLQATSLRILAPIPGKKVIGFEVPNSERRTIGFADLVEHRDLKSGKIALPVAMGVDAFGSVVIEDLAKMPHLLVAGSTGSGKSVFMNTLIGGLIARHTARDLRFIMIDPKMVELAAYNDLPHLACPVITDPSNEAKSKLDALVLEMEDRFNKMRIVGARNIQGFNDIIKSSKKANFPEFADAWQVMPFIVLIIDELADMMMVLGKDAEIPITRLAQKARAAGIHLVIATQRPSADVVTGLIKANFPTRVAFRVLSGLDSRTILDTSGAEGLIGQGDMLFLNAAGLRRMHGAYLSDGEVQRMVKACKAK